MHVSRTYTHTHLLLAQSTTSARADEGHGWLCEAVGERASRSLSTPRVFFCRNHSRLLGAVVRVDGRRASPISDASRRLGRWGDCTSIDRTPASRPDCRSHLMPASRVSLSTSTTTVVFAAAAAAATVTRAYPTRPKDRSAIAESLVFRARLSSIPPLRRASGASA